MDWIGFLISIAALIYLYFRNKPAPSQKERVVRDEKIPEELNPLQEFLKALDEREKEAQIIVKETPPEFKREKVSRITDLEHRHLVSPLERKRLVSSLEERRMASAIETRHVRGKITPAKQILESHHRFSVADTEIAQAPSRGRVALNHLEHLRSLVIYSEILGKPKGLQ